MDVQEQLKHFEEGFPQLELIRPARHLEGIFRIKENEEERLIRLYDNREVDVEKFVPASGAATRMFASLKKWQTEGVMNDDAKVFINNLSSFPFSINRKNLLEDLFEIKKWDQYPKALLPFHAYKSEVRTAMEEHLIEATQYGVNGNEAAIHFTVSPNHLPKFEEELETLRNKISYNLNVSFSFQKAETDTITVDLNNVPIKSATGEYIYRPAGHGALLENLNERTADIIFIKNIDNVVPDRSKKETNKYKKLLGGLLLDYQNRLFNLLRRRDEGENIIEEGIQLLQTLGIEGTFSDEEVLINLNRPIRICGMVKNVGEPGGGPFWVKNSKGRTSLQIVEGAQVNREDVRQNEVFNSATHFNPVDIVCGIKNYKGEKFDLSKFRDSKTGFIAQKTYNGQPVKALELPGLWNGSMADWNTVFVEVPLSTFNPVKTVNDLLRREHQP